MFKKVLLAVSAIMLIGSFTIQSANADGYRRGGYERGYDRGYHGGGYGPGPWWGGAILGLGVGVLVGEALVPPPPQVVVVGQPVPACRGFTQNVVQPNGVVYQYPGTACLGPDGQWHVVQ